MRSRVINTNRIEVLGSQRNANNAISIIQRQQNLQGSRSQLIQKEQQPLHIDLAIAIKQRQQDLIQEDECKAKLIKNKYKSTRSSQLDFQQNDESRARLKISKYQSVSKGYRLKQWESFLLLFFVLVIFLILFILDWVDLDDKDKYMGDSKLPWGFMYVIFTIPITIIQLANYSSQSQKEKELNVLIDDYKKMQVTSTIPNLDIQEFECNIQSHIDYMLTFFLLLYQFFSAGRANVIFQMVGLQFLGEFYKNIQRISSYQFLKFQELYDSENTNFVDEYSEIWDLKPLEQNVIGTEQNQSNIYLNIYHRIMNKLVVISDQILHSEGNQLTLIFFDLRMKFYLSTKVAFLIMIATIFGYSLQSKSIQENNQNDQFISLNFFPLLIIIIYQFADDMLVNPQIYEYFQQVDNLDYIRRVGELKDEQIRYVDVHGEIIRKFYNQQYFVQFFILLIQLTCMKYSSNQDGFFNIFALNYLLRMDLVGLDRYFYSLTIDDLKRISQEPRYKFPQALKYKTVDQHYCYVLELDVDIEQLKENRLTDQRISEILYSKLNKLQAQMKYEDSVMIQIIENSHTFKLKLFILLLEIGYCTMILEDKITEWSEKSREDILANGQFPWGLIFIIFTIPVLILQGLGNSEESKSFEKYFNLRKQFIQLRQGTISDRVFEWDDYDKIFCQIEKFNKIQAIILSFFLLVVQLFSLYAYEMLQNIVAFEFLYYLDEHALGTLSRYYYKYDNLQNSKREIKIPGQELLTNEQKYRFIWRI